MVGCGGLDQDIGEIIEWFMVVGVCSQGGVQGVVDCGGGMSFVGF